MGLAVEEPAGMKRLIFAAAVLLLAPAAGLAQTTFTVNSTSDTDDGTCDATHCSLREAINAANAAAGTDTIAFNIPGAGPHEIAPTSALPAVSGPVVIDGTTQPGYAGAPLIELDGKNTGGSVDGLELTGGASTVQGLAILDFEIGIHLSGAGGNTIRANRLGAEAAIPLCRAGNVVAGLVVSNSNNTIGGDQAGQGNELICNDGDGVQLLNGSDNIVRGNFVGTLRIENIDDLVPGSEPNGGAGIWIQNGSDNRIGGTGLLQGNVVAGNASGISLGGAAATGNRVEGNVIVGNEGDGIVLTNAGAGNRITSNAIDGNGALGIDLGADGVTLNDIGDGDTGPNNFQNYPVLRSVRVGLTAFADGILSSTPSSTFELEFYGNESCNASEHGEGASFLARSSVTTAGNGEATFSIDVGDTEPGTWVTATATAADGSTSEFSSCVQASTIALTITPDSVSVNKGAAATYLVEVAPVGGPFIEEVALRCDQRPPISSCTFEPDTLVPGASGVTSTLTLQTDAVGVISQAPGDGTRGPVWPGGLALGLPAIALLGLIGVRGDRRRAKLVLPLLVALLLGGAALQAGCDDVTNTQIGGGTPVGRYQVVVQATSGAVSVFETTILRVTP
jgi:CSLREA domain-containing protein